MSSKTIGLGIGALLIIIALILGAIEFFNVYDFTPAIGGRHLYVYGLFGVIGLIGIILAAWGIVKKETPKTTTQ